MNCLNYNRLGLKKDSDGGSQQTNNDKKSNVQQTYTNTQHSAHRCRRSAAVATSSSVDKMRCW